MFVLGDWCYHCSRRRASMLHLWVILGSRLRKMMGSHRVLVGVRLYERVIEKVYAFSVCVWVCVLSVGPALAHRFLGQVFRLPTRFKHHGVTFLSSVRVGWDKSGLAAALAASCYLVTFQTVGVGGLSQARPSWERKQGQVIHYCPHTSTCIRISYQLSKSYELSPHP